MRLICTAIILGLAVSHANAFQETRQGANQGAQVPAGAVAPAPAAPGDGMSLAPGGSAPASKGTEVRIPGLGTLGVLPKMDFGLELLYGAAPSESAPQEPASGIERDGDDLRIRGTLKHRF